MACKIAAKDIFVCAYFMIYNFIKFALILHIFFLFAPKALDSLQIGAYMGGGDVKMVRDAVLILFDVFF